MHAAPRRLRARMQAAAGTANDPKVGITQSMAKIYREGGATAFWRG